MSVSRCFRCALDAARPAKRINVLPISNVKTQSRNYADVSNPHRPQATGLETETIQKAPSSQNPEINSIQTPPKRAPLESTTESPSPSPILEQVSELRGDEDLPPNVQAAYRVPYKHPKTHGVKVASLQLRSYSVRNLELMADFALRVATYLELPVSGPVPLPKRIERWTMPRSNFVHKKSQENFERITLRRLITAYDGHPEVVEIWLACLRKWQYYGVGMKANVFQFEGLDVVSKMDEQARDVEKELDKKLDMFGYASKWADRKYFPRNLAREGRNLTAPGLRVREEIAGAKNVSLFNNHKFGLDFVPRKLPKYKKATKVEEAK